MAPWDTLADDIERHAVRNKDWSNAEILERTVSPLCSVQKLTRRDEGASQAARAGAFRPHGSVCRERALPPRR